MNQAGTGNGGGAPRGGGGGAGGTAPLPIPPGPVGTADAEAAQRAAEVALCHRMMMSGAANAEMMMAMAGGGGVAFGGVGGGGGSSGSGAPQDLGALLTHQYQSTQTIPYTLNPDGTPLLDHHYRPIPLQKILQTRPLKADVSTRPGPGNMKLTYMSGEVVTRTLNELFGFGGWSMEVRRIENSARKTTRAGTTFTTRRPFASLTSERAPSGRMSAPMIQSTSRWGRPWPTP